MALEEKDPVDIAPFLNKYNTEELTVATVCSHSSLQIFHGARKAGLRTLGIAIGKPPKFYDAFPLAKPDEFIAVDKYIDIMDRTQELLDRNVIIIPTGSFVEYLGATHFKNLPVPTFGNRRILEWESDRKIERKWLEGAGLTMPMEFKTPEEIDRPVMVKYQGAKGGRGFFIAKDADEFYAGVDPNEEVTIQEYIVGTRYYLHYFYSPIRTEGYRLTKGTLEVMSMDRRDETNIDEMYKLGSKEELRKHGIYPTFVVTGNVPLVLRESLLPKVFAMGENVVERSFDIGGMIGPFCLETVVTDQLEFKIFEISARIVAGTNIYPGGSPYSEYIQPGLSTGMRVGMEIKDAQKKGMLSEILS